MAADGDVVEQHCHKCDAKHEGYPPAAGGAFDLLVIALQGLLCQQGISRCGALIGVAALLIVGDELLQAVARCIEIERVVQGADGDLGAPLALCVASPLGEVTEVGQRNRHRETVRTHSLSPHYGRL